MHAWDVARAIGGDEQLDSELVATLLARLEEHGTGLETGGYFEHAATTPDPAPQTRLLLTVGRRL